MTHITYLLLMRTVHLSLMILAALQAGQIASSYSASGSKTGDVNDAAANFEYELSSMYLMDEYTISDRYDINLWN